MWNNDSERGRVSALAKTAKNAMETNVVISGNIELIIRSKLKRKNRNPGDAANFIGGIADVLQGWGVNFEGKNDKPVDMDQYKESIVYQDDKQIRRISYIEEDPAEGEPEHYIVTVIEF